MAKFGTKEYQEDLLNSVPKYLDSEETLAAKDKVGEMEGKIPPSDYKGTYRDQIAREISSYLGRDKFNYNPNSDATYQQIRNTYLGAGKKAMQDTLGSGAVLSGGNNNSAAQVAAQQVYNDYAGKVTDIIPTLEAQAYSRHRAELSDKLNDIGLLQGMDEQEYARHQNDIQNTMNLLNYYSGKYNSLVSKDQVNHSNDLAIWGQQLSAGQNQYQYQDSSLKDSFWQKIALDKQPNDAECKAAGVTADGARELRQKYKTVNTSVSKGGGGVKDSVQYKSTEDDEGKYKYITYSDSQLKDMETEGRYYDLYDYLSEKSTSYKNLVSLGKKYGLTSDAIDYYNEALRPEGDGKPKVTSITQAQALLSEYGKEGVTANVSGFYSQEEFERISTESPYNTYEDYLTANVAKNIVL